MKNTDNPCYQCPDRQVGCHSNCKRHNTWLSRCKEEKQKERLARLSYTEGSSYVKSRMKSKGVSH